MSTKDDRHGCLEKIYSAFVHDYMWSGLRRKKKLQLASDFILVFIGCRFIIIVIMIIIIIIINS